MQTETKTAQTDDARQWISTSSAAKRLGVSPRSIQRRCSAGTLPARRVNGARGEVWEVEAQAVEAERIKGDSDGDTATATRATATATTATQSKRVAVILPFARSKTATDDDDRATFDGDSDGDKGDSVAVNSRSVAVSVAVEAERLKAELAASRAETERERELSAFLKSQIEDANRNAAELRAALRKALEIAPRQLPAGTPPDGQQREQSGAANNVPSATPDGPQAPARRDGAPITYDSIATELERRLGL